MRLCFGAVGALGLRLGSLAILSLHSPTRQRTNPNDLSKMHGFLLLVSTRETPHSAAACIARGERDRVSNMF